MAMGRPRRCVIVLACLAGAFLWLNADAQERRAVVIGTGAPGGVYHPLGAALCRMINLDAAASYRCLAETSRGSLANIAALQQRKIDFAIVQSDVEEAATGGTAAFAGSGPIKTLRVVLTLHPEAFTVVARAGSGIASFADLRGKRVSIGDVGSGQRMTAEALLAAFGWTRKDFSAAELGPVEQDAALCAGRLDAIFYFVGHPNGLIQDVTARCHAHLVALEGAPVETLLKAEPYLHRLVVPGGLYEGNDRDTPTFGARAVLLTRADVPDAEVGALVKAVIDHFDVFRLLLPVLAGMTPADFVPTGLATPLHAGAKSALHELGLVQ